MLQIRPGRPADIPAVFDLIRELASYEQALDQVTNTVEQLAQDGFGPTPLFGLLVGEDTETAQIVGIALYYFRYSTWKGKRLYLEDIVVTESYRGRGAGKQLFEATVTVARQTGCTGLMWQVLDWNEPAITFYRQFGTRFDAEWTNCHLDF